MHSINCIILASAFLLFTGCGVSAFKAQNWNPTDHTDLNTELYRSKYLEICRHQAQLSDVSSNDAAYKEPGNGDRYANFNRSLLTACMEAKGYKLRELTGTEVFFDTVTAPIEFPMMILGQNIDDIY